MCYQEQGRSVFIRVFAVLVMCVNAVALYAASPLYVVNGGAGGETGADWANAMHITNAVAAATDIPTVLYIKDDTFLVSLEMTMSAQSITFDGGYVGSGTPGAKSGSKAIIQANSTNRLFTLSLSTAVFDTVTLRDGNERAPAGARGGALHLTSSSITLSNCTLLNNRVFPSSGNNVYHGGGAIYADNSDVYLYNSTITSNYCKPSGNNGDCEGGVAWMVNGGTLLVDGCTVSTNYVYDNGGRYLYVRGGAFSCGGTDITMLNSTFDGNYAADGSPDNYVFSGGVLRMENGTLTVTNCSFTGNYVRKGYGEADDREKAQGGVFLLKDITSASIVDSTFLENRVLGHNARGGVLYMLDGGDVAIDSCTFMSNGISGENGGIELAAGTLSIYNSLIAYCEGGSIGVTSYYNTNVITVGGGTLACTNVTIVDSSGWGVSNVSGTVSMRNSIVWGNAAGGISTKGGDSVDYTLSQEAHGGTGNLSVDPSFISVPSAYHLDAGGPAVDQGSKESWMVTRFDLDGDSRVSGSEVDMGCYEYQHMTSGIVFVIH